MQVKLRICKCNTVNVIFARLVAISKLESIKTKKNSRSMKTPYSDESFISSFSTDCFFVKKQSAGGVL